MRDNLSTYIAKREESIGSNSFHQKNRELIGRFLKQLNRGEATVLELGCGHADVSRKYIAPNCKMVVATDLTKNFIPNGDQKIKFCIQSALALSFKDKSFDVVVSLEVIEHLQEDLKFIEEGLRVLKKGGIFYFTTPNRLRMTASIRYLLGKQIRFPHTYEIDPVLGPITHEREYSYQDLVRLLSRIQSPIQYEIKGVWLGIPAWQIGILSPPSFLQKMAFNWHVRIEKK